MRALTAGRTGTVSLDRGMSEPGREAGETRPDEIVWGGHATVRITLGGDSVLTDPLLRSRVWHLQRIVPVVAGIADAIHAVLISHLHHDHLDLPSLRTIDPYVPVVIPAGARAALGRRMGREVIELAAGEVTEIAGLLVHAVPASHDGHRPGRPGLTAPAVGYVVARGGKAVYFAGDTDIFPGMAEFVPRPTCALLPVWGWGPTLGPGHLDPESAAAALTLLRPRLAVPIHYGTYRPRLGRGAPARAAGSPETRFAAAAARVAPEVAIRIVPPGGRVSLPPERPAPSVRSRA